MAIYLVFAICVLNNTMVQSARVLLPLYSLEFGANPLTIGILGATFSAFPMMLAVTAGKLADRFGARWLLMVGAIAAGIGLTASWHYHSMAAIFFSASMISLSTAIYNVSLQNLVGQLSEPETRAQNFSNFSLMTSSSSSIGPMIAGFAIDHAGHAGASLILTRFAVLGIVVLQWWGSLLPGGEPHVERKGSGIRLVLGEPGVRRTLAAGSLQNMIEGLVLFYLPVYMHSVHVSASAIGIVMAMYAGAAFVTRMALTRLISRLGPDRLLSRAFFLSACGLLLVPFFSSPWVLGALSFTLGLGMGCCGPIVTMLMFGNSPAGRSGETLGLKIMINHFTRVVTPVIFGSIATAAGLGVIFWLNSLMLGGGGMMSRPRQPRS